MNDYSFSETPAACQEAGRAGNPNGFVLRPSPAHRAPARRPALASAISPRWRQMHAVGSLSAAGLPIGPASPPVVRTVVRADRAPDRPYRKLDVHELRLCPEGIAGDLPPRSR